jgi:hypothetical protein
MVDLSARLQEAVDNRKDRPEVVLAKWKTTPFIRMLWSEYREARRDYRKHKKEWEEAIEALPVKFQKRIAKARAKTKDVAWFNYMELPYIVGSMETATQASEVFKKSVWTKADRVTFAGCEDLQTIRVCWENLLLDLEKADVEVTESDRSVPWREYEMTEVRDIMALVSMLLD